MLPAVADRTAPGASPSGGAPGDPANPNDGTDSEAVPVRPLAWRELADLPFAVLQRRIRTIAGPAGAGFALAWGVVLGTSGSVSLLTGGSSTGKAWAAVLSTAVCAWVLRLWVTVVTVPIGLAVVTEQPITAGAAVRRGVTVAGRLARHHLISTLTGLGILLLGAPLVATLLPTLIWLGRVRGRRWSVPPILVSESAPYATAVDRAKMLATGRVMPLAGLWIHLRALLLVLAVPVAGLLGFLTDILGTHRWAVVTLLSGGVLLITAFAAALDAAAGVVVYVDRRCRREGSDIRIPTGQVIR